MSMNAFRLIGDFAHLFGLIFLLVSILFKKSCHGISGKTQILFLMVYVSRYLDLLTTYISIYNSAFKIVYILSTAVTCFFIFVLYRKTYQSKEDTVITEIAVFGCFTAAIFRNYEMVPTEIMWSFSEFLESVALIPQFFLIINTKTMTWNALIYLVALFIYRSFYCLNWIYRYYEEDYIDSISDFSGTAFIMVFILYTVIIFLRRVQMERETQLMKRNIFFITQTTNPIIPDIEKSDKDIEKNNKDIDKNNKDIEKDKLITDKI